MGVLSMDGLQQPCHCRTRAGGGLSAVLTLVFLIAMISMVNYSGDSTKEGVIVVLSRVAVA